MSSSRTTRVKKALSYLISRGTPTKKQQLTDLFDKKKGNKNLIEKLKNKLKGCRKRNREILAYPKGRFQNGGRISKDEFDEYVRNRTLSENNSARDISHLEEKIRILEEQNSLIDQQRKELKHGVMIPNGNCTKDPQMTPNEAKRTVISPAPVMQRGECSNDQEADEKIRAFERPSTAEENNYRLSILQQEEMNADRNDKIKKKQRTGVDEEADEDEDDDYVETKKEDKMIEASIVDVEFINQNVHMGDNHHLNQSSKDAKDNDIFELLSEAAKVSNLPLDPKRLEAYCKDPFGVQEAKQYHKNQMDDHEPYQGSSEEEEDINEGCDEGSDEGSDEYSDEDGDEEDEKERSDVEKQKQMAKRSRDRAEMYKYLAQDDVEKTKRKVLLIEDDEDFNKDLNAITNVSKKEKRIFVTDSRGRYFEKKGFGGNQNSQGGNQQGGNKASGFFAPRANSQKRQKSGESQKAAGSGGGQSSSAGSSSSNEVRSFLVAANRNPNNKNKKTRFFNKDATNDKSKAVASKAGTNTLSINHVLVGVRKGGQDSGDGFGGGGRGGGAKNMGNTGGGKMGARANSVVTPGLDKPALWKKGTSDSVWSKLQGSGFAATKQK
jgi:hypothetical protein